MERTLTYLINVRCKQQRYLTSYIYDLIPFNYTLDVILLKSITYIYIYIYFAWNSTANFLGNHFGHAISSSSNIVGIMLRHQHLQLFGNSCLNVFDATILRGNMKPSDAKMTFSYYRKIKSRTINNILQKTI